MGDGFGRIATGIALIAWMTSLSVVDIREHRLPNIMTLPGAAVILMCMSLFGRGLPALGGAAALGGAYLLVHLVAPTAMGAGDVKLAVGLGALTGALGTQVWALAALGAPLVTVGWAVLARRHTVPHGPSMCLATSAAVALAEITG